MKLAAWSLAALLLAQEVSVRPGGVQTIPLASGSSARSIPPQPPGEAASSLLTGLVAYYPLESSAGTDVHGGFTLTAQDGAVSYAAGKLGNAAIFSGVAGRLLNASLEPGITGAGFSGSAWIRTNMSVAGARPVLGENTTSNPSWIIQTNQATTKLQAVLRASGALNQVPVAAGNDSAWHLVVITYDPVDRKLRIYQDNAAAVVSSGTGTQNNLTDNNVGFVIGGAANTFNHTVAEIDEVGLWNKALTSSEVACLFGGGTPPAYPFEGVCA